MTSKHGQKLSNGTWIGMFSYIMRPELNHQFIAFFGHLLAYFGMFEFPANGLVLTSSVVNFIIPKPKIWQPWYSFILPFGPLTWLCTIVSFIFICIIQGLIQLLLFRSIGKKLNFYNKNKFFENALFMPISHLLEQGLTNIPRGFKYTSAITLLAGTIILGTGYKSTLRANLSFPKDEPIPQYYADLLQNQFNNYILKFKPIGNIDRGFIEHSIFRKLSSQSRIKIEQDLDEAIRTMYDLKEEQKSVVLGWSTLIEMKVLQLLTLHNRISPVIYSKYFLFAVTGSCAFSKGSRYVNGFTGIFYSVIESGIFNKKWLVDIKYDVFKKGTANISRNSKWNLYKSLMELKKRFEFERAPLSFKNLQMIFFLLLIGCFLGFLSFLIEIKDLIKLNCIIKDKISTIYTIIFEFFLKDIEKFFLSR